MNLVRKFVEFIKRLLKLEHTDTIIIPPLPPLTENKPKINKRKDPVYTKMWIIEELSDIEKTVVRRYCHHSAINTETVFNLLGLQEPSPQKRQNYIDKLLQRYIYEKK